MPCSGGGTTAAASGGYEYVDRGDPAAADWGAGDLTRDDTWRDLDLSSVVTDSDAEIVHFQVLVLASAANKIFWLRTNGNSNEINVTKVRTQVANQRVDADAFVVPDGDLKIEYRCPSTIGTMSLVVRGWFHPA